MLKIESAQISKLNEQEIARAYSLMRHAYAVTEIEIWGENYERMSPDDFLDLIKREEIILARIDDEVVGSIHTYALSEDSYCFGLFSADFNKKGLGIGRALIAAVEKRAIENGALYMELEILKPRDFDSEVKINLHNWYQRLGYELVKSMSFIERKPDKIEKAKSLKTPSVFDCYRRHLT